MRLLILTLATSVAFVGSVRAETAGPDHLVIGYDNEGEIDANPQTCVEAPEVLTIPAVISYAYLSLSLPAVRVRFGHSAMSASMSGLPESGHCWTIYEYASAVFLLRPPRPVAVFSPLPLVRALRAGRARTSKAR
jgi:hypothetical protein